MTQSIDFQLKKAISKYLSSVLGKGSEATETGQALAAALHISPAAISAAKNGDKLLSLEHIIRICQRYEISVDEFLDLKIVKADSDKGEQGNIQWQVNKPKGSIAAEIQKGIRLFEDGVKHIENPVNLEWSSHKSLHDGDDLHKLDVVLRSGIVQLKEVPRDTKAEEEVKARYTWLKEVQVIKLTRNKNNHYSNADTIKAECAAFLASQTVNNEAIDLKGESVALGQGYAVRRMAAQLPFSSESFKGTKWVSTISERVRGHAFSNHTASSIVSELGWRYPSSEVIYLPYLTSTANLMDYTSRKAIDAVHAAKVFFTTINSLQADDFRRRGEREPVGISNLLYAIRENESFKSQILTLYQDKLLDANGEVVHDPKITKLIKDTVYSIEQFDVDIIGQFHNTWLIAVGAHKKIPVLSVLRSQSHLVNSLIIDSEIAEYIIENTPLDTTDTLEATF